MPDGPGPSQTYRAFRRGATRGALPRTPLRAARRPLLRGSASRRTVREEPRRFSVVQMRVATARQCHNRMEIPLKLIAISATIDTENVGSGLKHANRGSGRMAEVVRRQSIRA